VVIFTTNKWIIKLDTKNRLVLPLKARKSLNIKDRILLELKDNGNNNGNELVITKSNGESGDLISKNCEEVEHFEWPL